MITHVAIKSKVNGKVFSLPCPKRHHDVISLMVKAREPTPISTLGQGFLDDQGNFMDRLQAGTYAVACRQIARLKWPPYLYSEDLW